MRFLVDGYNLMHAAGYLTATPAGKLEPTRRRFLDWLAGVVRAKPAAMHVVFDGRSASSTDGDHRGVGYSFGRTADDEIEARLDEASAGVVVVSNDGRLHESARRAGATAWRCERFIDWIISEERLPAAVPPPVEEKPTALAADAELLAAFQQPRGRRR